MILIGCCGTAGMSTRDSCSIEPFVQGHGCVGLQTATVNPKPGTVILVVWTSSVWLCSQELPRSCAATHSLPSSHKLSVTAEVRKKLKPSVKGDFQGISRRLLCFCFCQAPFFTKKEQEWKYRWYFIIHTFKSASSLLLALFTCKLILNSWLDNLCWRNQSKRSSNKVVAMHWSA